MPIIAPTPGDVHVNSILTSISIAYMQDLTGFVADRAFPVVPVAKQSDIYWVWPRDSWNRDEMKVRAPGAETAGTSFEIAKAPYYAPVKGIHHDIPDQVLANADSPIAYDNAATMLVTHKAAINREISWITNYFSPGVWQFSLDGVTAGPTARPALDPTVDANNNVLNWNDAASTPIEDIRYAMTYTQMRSGFRPNRLTLSRPVWDVLQDHPDIVARIDRGQTPNGPARASRENLAALLELDEVLVMDGIVNAAKQGLVENNQFFGGKNALLTYAPKVPALMMPSAGYTFAWTGYLGATPNGTRIKRFYIDKEASTRVECETAYAHAMTGTDLGFFFRGIIA